MLTDSLRSAQRSILGQLHRPHRVGTSKCFSGKKNLSLSDWVSIVYWQLEPRSQIGPTASFWTPPAPRSYQPTNSFLSDGQCLTGHTEQYMPMGTTIHFKESSHPRFGGLAERYRTPLLRWGVQRNETLYDKPKRVNRAKSFLYTAKRTPSDEGNNTV